MRKKFLTLVATLCVCTLALAACSDDKKDKDADNKKETSSTTSTTAAATADKSIIEIATSDPDNFSTLLSLAGSAGLDQVLQAEGTYTVFAPVNAAFESNAEQLEAVNSNPAALKQVLTYHAINTQAYGPDDLEDGLELTTVEGSKLTIGKSGDKITVTTDKGVTVNVLKTVNASNGVVYAIDGILIPADLVL